MTTLIRRTGVTAEAGAGPRLSLVKNVVNNPRAVNLASLTATFGTGGAGTASSVMSGGPLSDCPSFYRLMWNTPPSASGAAQIRNGAAGVNLVVPGKRYVFKVWVRSTVPMTVQAKLGWWNEASYVAAAPGPEVGLTANMWKQLTFEGVAPANANRVQLNSDPTVGSILPVAGTTLDVTGWFVYEKPAVDNGAVVYADGDSFGWSWLGTPHASPSQGFGAVVS